MLKISKNKQTLLKDGKTFFYLADTCWSAFTNISDEEWDYYLYKRKVQGFNAIQINILPQWDASLTNFNFNPFINNNPIYRVHFLSLFVYTIPRTQKGLQIISIFFLLLEKFQICTKQNKESRISSQLFFYL